MIKWKRDIVDEAQAVMNANQSLSNKNLISSLTNEIIALRHEIERLETKMVNAASAGVKTLVVGFDRDGKVDSVESSHYE